MLSVVDIFVAISISLLLTVRALSYKICKMMSQPHGSCLQSRRWEHDLKKNVEHTLQRRPQNRIRRSNKTSYIVTRL